MMMDFLKDVGTPEVAKRLVEYRSKQPSKLIAHDLRTRPVIRQVQPLSDVHSFSALRTSSSVTVINLILASLPAAF